MFELWPQAEQRRLQVALNALQRAANWKSLRQHKAQAAGAQLSALREVVADASGEMHACNSTIADDSEFIARLQQSFRGAKQSTNLEHLEPERAQVASAVTIDMHRPVVNMVNYYELKFQTRVELIDQICHKAQVMI